MSSNAAERLSLRDKRSSPLKQRSGTTLRRFKKEDGVIYHIPSSPDLASLFALDESKPILVIPPTLSRKSSSPLIAIICPLRADLLKDFIGLSPSSDKKDCIKTRCDESQKLMGLGGGVAVCASGPENLMRDAQNAVARLGLTMGMDVGGIALHTELFTL
ncbi:uncharacterized protein F5891DRAFT_1241288 [Suillus fuscotomentosus]|uniref:Uncharacterized protein n=1 Tax=Suillus fuscotomentosus TaxID=1912939 RepID=A0AAD4HIQ3_9AGAM|nr:uncharacterized protein F5891DRAFT_1241288 [Suillus fuscotomentosus]KAG1897641.1 hypothetical protein F5891DRAFT_1241288 [Suillus fuscotomentosus]